MIPVSVRSVQFGAARVDQQPLGQSAERNWESRRQNQAGRPCLLVRDWAVVRYHASRARNSNSRSSDGSSSSGNMTAEYPWRMRSIISGSTLLHASASLRPASSRMDLAVALCCAAKWHPCALTRRANSRGGRCLEAGGQQLRFPIRGRRGRVQHTETPQKHRNECESVRHERGGSSSSSSSSRRF